MPVGNPNDYPGGVIPSTGGGSGSGQTISGPPQANPSGQQTDQLAQANALWQQNFGRPLNSNELQWLQQGRGDVGSVSMLDAAKREAGKLQTLSANIQQQASAYGLNLTPDQVNQIRENSFRTGDPNADVSFGGLVNANLQRLATNQAKTDVQNQINTKNNPTVSQENKDAVDNTFQQIYGRHPNGDERAFFAKEIAQGLSPYELSQSLMGTQEYKDAQTAKQQASYTQQAQAASSALNDQLMQTQNTAFNNALPEIISSFQRQGRVGSSGVQNAIAKQMAVLDQQRQQTLANLNYQTTVQGLGYNQQNFVNNQNQSFQNYLNQQGPQLAQQYNMQNIGNNLNYQMPFQGLQNQQGLSNQNLGNMQSWQNAQYNQQNQQNDMNRYLDSQNKSAWMGLIGNLGGAAIRGGAMAATGGRSAAGGALYG